MATPDATDGAERDRFHVLPQPPPREAWVETVDAGGRPVPTDEEERARLLRLAGGGEP